MAKYERKKTKTARSTGPSKEATRRMTKIKEYVGNLSELHKLQGTLLNRLRKEVSERR